MRSLEMNDWIFMNDLIYKIYSINDIAMMEKAFLENLRTIMPFDVATFYLSTDFSADSVPVSIGIDPDNFISTYIENMNIDYTKWVFSLSKSAVFRESDLWHDDEREQMPYYRTMYQPLNLHHAAVAGLVFDGKFVGCCNFYNKKESGDFSDKALFILDILKDHLALRLSKDLLSQTEQNGQICAEQFCSEIDLTKKEAEVLGLILNGLSIAEASKELCISPNTLKNHLQSIYSKAGVKNKFQLYQKADRMRKNS